MRRVALATGGGALLALGFPPWSAPFLLPLGFALLVLALEGARTREALVAGLCAGLAHYGATLFWLPNLFGAAAVPLVAILALFTALFGASFACASRRLWIVPLWVSAPILWTGIEVYRSEWFVLRFGWSGLGYAMAACAVPLQAASVVGSYGLTFLIAAFGTALRSAWRRPTWRGPALVLYAVWCALCLARPLQEKLPTRAAMVRLVQASPEDEGALFGMSRLEPGVRPAFIVWPELALQRDPRTDPRLWRRVEEVARSARGAFVLGVKVPAGDSFRNTALVLGPDGQVLGEHVKNHTVHFLRDGVPGTEARAIETPAGRIGVAVCFDLDFPDVARRLVQDGAEVILSPSYNPRLWGAAQREQRRLLLRMRAVESRRWVAAADVGGSSVIVDPKGRDRWQSRDDGVGRIDGVIGLDDQRSRYVRWGWQFGPLCLVLALILMAAVAVSAARAEVARRHALASPGAKGGQPDSI
ncbi:MAG TPA: nitrilase-related carbon-nitrogen hydrolase [Chthonomonadales bacterium]|nr:nitrilase-related carbon-nitrogen hydrolase [Chthonomonadales bacterium]